MKFLCANLTVISEDQYSVRIYKVPNSSKLPLERVRMHIHGQKFCFTSHSPPKILAAWQISDLRRFGMVEGKFVFEGGSRCGKGDYCRMSQYSL